MVGRVFLDRYEVLELLGEGNMGRVFLAQDLESEEQVVVKVMHDKVAADPKFRELFEHEMEVMSRFKHPNVVELYDASADPEAGLCIVMEYVDGTDLELLLEKQRSFEVERVARLLGQLCSALAHAHSLDIIHRDLKPANLMVLDPDTDEEVLKVMDFGLAKLSGGFHLSLDKLKGNDTTIATGTPEYMAPEQVRGDELDHRSDLYSVGVILFEMLTGRLPFIRRTIPELLEAHASAPTPTFTQVGAAGVVSPAVEQVVLTCLAKYPVERPQDAWDLGVRFGKALGMKIMEGEPPPPPKPGSSGGQASAPLDEDEDDAVVHHLEAYMPERIAVVKLKGYVDDMGGEIVESVAGKIRVHFGQPGCRYQVKGKSKGSGPLAWFGFGGSGKGKLIEMELQMAKKDPKASMLDITVLLRPEEGGPLPRNPDWHETCEKIYTDLRAYLITK